MPTAKGRWVRKDRRIYNHSTCLYCGSAYGICKGEAKAHQTTTCMACGTEQCMGNGLARGTCSICHVGLLPGWAGNYRKCQYRDCGEQAVARCDGQNVYRCKKHLEQGKWKDYVGKQVEDRWRSWEFIGPFDVPAL